MSYDLRVSVKVEGCDKYADGGCYTSLKVHTQIGFGYAVCHECHVAEMEEL